MRQLRQAARLYAFAERTLNCSFLLRQALQLDSRLSLRKACMPQASANVKQRMKNAAHQSPIMHEGGPLAAGWNGERERPEGAGQAPRGC